MDPLHKRFAFSSLDRTADRIAVDYGACVVRNDVTYDADDRAKCTSSSGVVLEQLHRDVAVVAEDTVR